VLDIDRTLLPAFLTLDNQKEFFIRMSNTTRSLDPEETVKYINQNWG